MTYGDNDNQQSALLEISIGIPYGTDSEIQLIAALAGVVNHFSKNEFNCITAEIEQRVAAWFFSRYGGAGK